MLELFQFLNEIPYLDVALQLAMAGHGLALAIVNLTPTPKDDEYLATAYKYIEFAAGIITKKAKA